MSAQIQWQKESNLRLRTYHLQYFETSVRHFCDTGVFFYV